MKKIRVVRDQDGTEIHDADIILDERGRCYRVVDTPNTLRAQQIISGVRVESWRAGAQRSAEYVRAYHAFIIDRPVTIADGKRLHRQRLSVASEQRRAAMKTRHQSTDQTLRDRGVRG